MYFENTKKVFQGQSSQEEVVCAHGQFPFVEHITNLPSF